MQAEAVSDMCPNCERLITADSESRVQRFALFDIENFALMKGQWAIARMAREARLGKIGALDNSNMSAIIQSQKRDIE